MCIAFVEKAGTVSFNGKLATVVYRSGEDQFIRIMPIEEFRAFIAMGTAKLNEYDAAQRKRIVAFKRERSPAH